MNHPPKTREALIEEWRENRAAYLVIHPEDKNPMNKKSDTSDLVEKFPQGREEPEEESEPENFNKKKLAADYISDDYRRFLGRFGPFEVTPLSQDREEVVVEEAEEEEAESTHLTEFYNDGENEHVVISYSGSLKR